MLRTLCYRMWHGILYKIKKKYLIIDCSKNAFSVFDSFWKWKCDNHQEYLLVLTISSLGFVRDVYIHNQGDSEHVVIFTSELFKKLYAKKSVAFYIAHNHPDENTMPSNLDVDATNYLMKYSAILGFKMLDHFILTTKTYSSILY